MLYVREFLAIRIVELVRSDADDIRYFSHRIRSIGMKGE